MRKKLSYEDRYKICKKCPNFSKFWKTCRLCGCFMPLKTKLRWVECPDEPPRWTQEMLMALTAKQKKLPKALQRAILAKQKGMGKKKKKNGKKKKGGKKRRSRG